MFVHYVLTLNGAEQSLLDAVAGAGGQVGGANDPSLRAIVIQADGANANPVFVGGVGVTTALYAVRLDKGAAGVPSAPLQFQAWDSGPLHLSDFHVIGTSTEKVRVGIIPY